MKAARCKARRADGQPCNMKPGQDGYCFNHSPARARARAQARRHGGQARHTPHFAEAPAAEIVSAQDARRILAYVLAELLGMENSIQRNRALLAVHDGYIQSFKLGEFEQRLMAIEAALHIR